jgi:hypothetical protein
MSRVGFTAVLLLAGLGMAGSALAQGPVGPGAMPYPVPPGAGPVPGYPVPPGGVPAPGCPVPTPSDGTPDEGGIPAGNAFNDGGPHCGHTTNLVLDIEYLRWWLKPESPPALVTTGFAGDSTPGAIGQPGTHVLFGDNVDEGSASGVRGSAGWWFGGADGPRLGLEIGGFFFEDRAADFSTSSDNLATNEILARPFVNPATGAEDANELSKREARTGSANGSVDTHLWGAEANVRFAEPFGNQDGPHFGLLAGVRYLGLNDGLNIADQFSDTRDNLNFSSAYSYTTQNRFYGGQAGFDMEFRALHMSLDLQAKFGVGQNEESVDSFGSASLSKLTAADIRKDARTFSVVQPADLGNSTHDRISFVPEVDVNWGLEFSDYFRFFVGYSFLYWNGVARAGDQVTSAVTTTPVNRSHQTSTITLPDRGAQPAILNGNFWAQGLNLGFEFRY